MRSIPTTRCLMAVLWTGLYCTGCAHPTYSPYGYGSGNGYGPSYGPTYPAPQYMAPGGGPTYTPQPSTQSLGSPTPLTNPPVNRDPIQWKQPATPPTNDAPMFDPNPKGAVPPGRDPLDDLNNANPGASLPQGSINTAKLPVYQKGGLAAAAPPVIADVVQTVGGTEGDPFFEAPSRLPPMGDAAPMSPPESMYGHDGQSYKWLKGTVDYDDKTQTWSIIYNLAPDATDKFGGSLVITPHMDLGNLQIGDVALLEGTIDPKDRDATGRQIYTVTKVTGPIMPANPKQDSP